MQSKIHSLVKMLWKDSMTRVTWTYEIHLYNTSIVFPERLLSFFSQMGRYS